MITPPALPLPYLLISLSIPAIFRDFFFTVEFFEQNQAAPA